MHYRWSVGGSLPFLLRHSEVKHSLLRDYLVDYFLTLFRSPGQDQIQLTLIDGFCGGGRYVNERNEVVPGSPLVILQSLKEAEARLYETHQLRKAIVFDVELICVDEDPSAIDHLRHVLVEEGHEEKLRDGSIKLLEGDFVSNSGAILQEVKRRSPRAGRAVYVLDQYGYDQVPASALQAIFGSLKGAEVILTFNVDSLINFLSEKNLRDFERKTEFTGALSAAHLDTAQRTPGWRREVQANLYQRIVENSRASYFTPFFIRPERGHGDFWLVHLSRHWKARDVMTTAHWRHQNHFIHYGGAGFNMMSTGYAARVDDTHRPQTAFEFDDAASKRSENDMLSEIPRELSITRDGITFETFFLQRINSTPATQEMVEQALLHLVRDQQIEVVGADGSRRNVRTALKKDHVLRLPAQRSFLLPSKIPVGRSASRKR